MSFDENLALDGLESLVVNKYGPGSNLYFEFSNWKLLLRQLVDKENSPMGVPPDGAYERRRIYDGLNRLALSIGQKSFIDLGLLPETVEKQPDDNNLQSSSPIDSNANKEKDDVLVLRLQLMAQSENQMEVRGIEVPGGGTPRAVVTLPFPDLQLPAVLKALDVGIYIKDRFKKYRETLIEMDLLKDERLVADLHEQIGKILFNTLFSGEILTEFELARRLNKPVICQLQFDTEDVLLAQYPWELLHDNAIFVAPTRSGVELTRTIAFAKPPSALETMLPLKILYIAPRPSEDAEISSQSHAIEDGFELLKKERYLTMRPLDPPTWSQFEEILFNEKFDIIHFDGHGSFARACPVCGLAHYPSVKRCVACGADMSDIASQGYLNFEYPDKSRDRVKVDDLAQIVVDSRTRLVNLSACGSAVVQGTSVFNGIAPALIQIGIPAVVAMQGSPPDPSSSKFVQRFYAALARGMRIPKAVNLARRAILRPEAGEPVAWWMPVVYIRSSDNSYGRLFQVEGEINNE